MQRLSASVVLLCALAVLSFTDAGAQTWYRQSGGTVVDSYKHYTSIVNDSSGAMVTNTGTFRLYHSTIITSGNTSQADSSSANGLNAGVLVKVSSTGDFRNDTIYTTGRGAIGLYVIGAGSSATMTNGRILTTGRRAHGVDVTNTATATIINTEISTTNDTSSAIAADYGGGTIHVTGGTISAAGQLSAGIYSKGDIHVTNATVTSFADHGAVIDADGKVYLTNTVFTGAKSGFMVRNTAGMPFTATIELNGGSITASDHGFYDTAAKVNITIKNHATVTTGSGNLLYTLGGGTMNATLQRETLTGDVYADNTSIVNVVLQDTTKLTAKITNASVTLDGTSEWIVDDTSHINVLTNATGVNLTALTVSNIKGNGRNVYYKSSLSGNSWLSGNHYTLAGGGCLLPEGAVCGIISVPVTTIAANKINIYPNPVFDNLSVSLSAAHAATILEVVSLDGRILRSVLLETGIIQANIDVRDLPGGLYMMILTDNTDRQVLKFIKQ